MKTEKEKKEMNVYRVETGVTYYVAGLDIGSAKATFLEGAKDFEDLNALAKDGFSIDKVPRENWPKTFNDDGEGNPEASFPDLVSSTKSAAVLICSEWP